MKIASVLFAAVLVLQASVLAAQSSFKDSDWNTAFRDNSGLPAAVGGVAPVAWTTVGQDKKLRFTLQKGQVGLCSNDNVARHRAPYWERAELAQVDRLSVGQVNTIDFEATFEEGFRGKRESFFQIHSWARGCNASPPLMMKMHKGKLQIMALKGAKSTAGGVSKRGSHKSVFRRTIRVDALYGKPSKFRVVFDARGEGRGALSVFLNGQGLVDRARIDFALCGAPHVKFGIYRPGGMSERSVVVFDDVVIGHK